MDTAERGGSWAALMIGSELTLLKLAAPGLPWERRRVFDGFGRAWGENLNRALAIEASAYFDLDERG